MSLVAIGQLTLVLAIVNWFIVRDSPSKVGLPPIAKVDGQGIPHDSTSIEGSYPSLIQRLNTVFSNKRLWPLFLLAFGIYGSYATLVQNWAVVYIMQTYSLPRDLAANFVLVAAIGHIVGFPLAGFISDRMKKRRFPSVLFSGILLASFLLWTFWNSGRPPLEALYPLCFFISLGTGAIPIIFAAVGDLTGPSYRGTASGLVNSGLFAGAAIAQPLFGYILDMGWEGKMTGDMRIYPLSAFQQGFYLCCAMAALGFLGALLVKETRCREIYGTQD